MGSVIAQTTTGKVRDPGRLLQQPPGNSPTAPPGRCVPTFALRSRPVIHPPAQSSV